jgi:guanylate kinase
VGKGTVGRRLLEKNPHALAKAVTATTRAPRPGEFDGVHYRFMTRDEFLTRRDRGDFLETAEIFGNLYGTLKEEVEKTLARDVTCLLEIDVQGARHIRESGFPQLSAFLVPPSLEDLERRLRHRGTETEDVIRRRLATAVEELKEKDHYDRVIVNDHIDAATKRLEEFLKERGALAADTDEKK